MTITKDNNGNELKVTVTGRLDTTTAPELEEELRASIGGVACSIRRYKSAGLFL